MNDSNPPLTEKKNGLPGLRAVMDKKGYTLSTLANKMGMNQHSLYRLTSGTNGASQKTLLALSDALEVTTDQLLGRAPLDPQAAASEVSA